MTVILNLECRCFEFEECTCIAFKYFRKNILKSLFYISNFYVDTTAAVKSYIFCDITPVVCTTRRYIVNDTAPHCFYFFVSGIHLPTAARRPADRRVPISGLIR
jgi:hypothetical protein